jgi:hypothetical protein
MKFKNETSGDVIEVPPPRFGKSSIILNGEVLFLVEYSDNPTYVRVLNGPSFSEPERFAEWVVSLIAPDEPHWVSAN